MKITFRILGLFAALILAQGEAAAQSYPSKPIKLVVAYAPGGGTDTLARILGPRLSERLGQPVTVENKPGANAFIGAEYAAKSAPDGHTLLVGSDSEMVFNSGLYERLPYDSEKDFVPVIRISSQPLVFSVHPSLGVNSLKELLDLARAKPGGLFYSAGAPVFQVATELLKKQTGVDMVFVPFKGTGPALNAAIAGETPVATLPQASALAQLRAGKLRALAITSLKRSALLPDVPTVAESGVPNFEVVPWTGLFAPAGTPAAIVDRLYSEMALILKRDDVQARFTSLGLNISGMPPAELAALLKADVAKWRSLLRGLNIRAE